MKRKIWGNSKDDPRQSLNRNNTPMGEIKTIAGGFAKSCPTSSSKKAHAERASYKEVFTTKRPPKQAKNQKVIAISFSDED